ncbi:DUF2262 domain-containing protein [Vibrio sp. WXL103]|uniref:DUF2262 domain-containing protein n=1 Tax=Vibrio sp. WXL103 TaxID=3450710 RepID=UPI003EC6021D
MDLFEEANRRLSILMETFKHTNSKEIVGLVGPTGAASSKCEGENQWDVIFSLENWRYLEESDLKDIELTVRKEVSEQQLGEYQKAIDIYTPYRLKVKVVESSDFGGAQAYLEKIVGKSDDRELLALAAELQRSLTLEDELLGKFTLNRNADWFESETNWGKEKICLCLSTDECTDENAPLEMAKKLWQDQEGWSQKVFDFAAEELLELKNDAWLEEGEPEVTKDQFIEKMKLESITVYPDGEFEFWHHDGDLFWGHSIQVSGSLTEGLISADILG